VADGQEDAVLALERWVAFLPAAPDDLPRERVDGFLLVSAQLAPFARRGRAGVRRICPSLMFCGSSGDI